MCGIIGYTGPDRALPALVEGLGTLVYRGYDSAGVAVVDDRAEPTLRVVKRAGKLDQLQRALDGQELPGSCGIGHTRWATHGDPSDRNSHPHLDPAGDLAVVHNGILENHVALRDELRAAGHRMVSDTDTEVIAHLVAVERERAGGPGDDPAGRLVAAVRAVAARLDGAFAVAVIDRAAPGVIVAFRRHAPLVLGRTDGTSLLSSDVAGLISHTREIHALLDGQVAVLRPEGIEVSDVDGAPAEPHVFTVDWDVEAAERQGYPHFMLKEIHEQPEAVRETLLGRLGDDGRLRLDESRLDPGALAAVDKVHVVACGTSHHAGLVAKHAIERWARIPVEVEIASEFRYRDPILTPRTLVVGISQSGETADTLGACGHARDQRAAAVIGLTNVVGSTMAREADGVLYTRAGPEIGVAATKTFTTQVVALQLLALHLAQERGALDADEVAAHLDAMGRLPDLIERSLAAEDRLADLGRWVAEARYVMFIGRHVGLPIAMEGALKLKEISYVHAEGLPAGEMKHGPIALIEPGGPVIALATAGHVRDKVLSNVAEVRARGAEVCAVATEGDEEVAAHATHVVFVPEVPELLAPVLTVVPLQLIGYHAAVALGRDVDQPRNLAKTVTVE